MTLTKEDIKTIFFSSYPMSFNRLGIVGKFQGIAKENYDILPEDIVHHWQAFERAIDNKVQQIINGQKQATGIPGRN